MLTAKGRSLVWGLLAALFVVSVILVADLRPKHEAYLKAYKTRWDKPVQEFIVAGEWAFERYSYKSTDTPRDGGPVMEDTGWGFVVYHHDADGKWRVARDAWGPDHPAAPK